MFKQKSGGKPEGGVVQADKLFDVPAGTAVIPGAEGMSGEKMPSDELG